MTSPLLQTKLYHPSRRPDLIARPQLITLLNEGLQRKLTFVSAPAGFGKTTLISEWIEQAERPFVWVSLDEDDNDVATLFAYLAKAIEAIKDVDNSLQRLVAVPSIPAKSLATAFINDLALAEPCGLVLDDYHLITNNAIHEVLTYILDHLPPTVHLVITSRVDPLLPFPRLRARGEMTEIRTDDLRFSEAEMAQFLQATIAAPLSPQQLTLLEERTEGWIAGIHMAALSLVRITNADAVAEFIKDFTGSHRFIFDYLMDEVLAQRPAGTRDFLLQTSILDRFCAALCDAVLGLTDGGTTHDAPSDAPNGMAIDAQAVLTELEHANLFIVPLDNERRWYRYHHLFRDLLQKRLAETDAAAMPMLYERASFWYEQNGELETAFHYARRGGHSVLAARLLDEISLPLIGNSEIPKLLELIQYIPEIVRPDYVRLCLAYAWSLMLYAHYERAGAAVAHAEMHLNRPEALPPDLPESLLVAMIATLRAYIATRTLKLDEALHYSTVALAALDNPDIAAAGIASTAFPRGSIHLNLGITYHKLGEDVRAAERAYLAALPLNHAVDRPFSVIANYSNFMRLRQSQGQFDEAIALGREGLAWISAQGERLFPAEVEIRDTLGSIYYERNELDMAEAHMHRANELRVLALPNTDLKSYLPLGALSLARGDLENAIEIFRHVEERIARQEFQLALNGDITVPQMKLLLWRLQPHETHLLVELKQWVETSGLTVEDTFYYRQEAIYAALAQVLLALGNAESALSLIQRLCDNAEKAQRFGDLFRHQIVHALALDALQQRDKALAILQQALTFAESIGAVCSFIDQGAPLHALLRAVPATPYRNHLLASFGESIKTAIPATEQDLIEPLSSRELEVLQLLARGYANQEIANELIVALSTVKRHVSNIYGKLAVGSRTEAVAHARELDLL